MKGKWSHQNKHMTVISSSSWVNQKYKAENKRMAFQCIAWHLKDKEKRTFVEIRQPILFPGHLSTPPNWLCTLVSSLCFSYHLFCSLLCTSALPPRAPHHLFFSQTLFIMDLFLLHPSSLPSNSSSPRNVLPSSLSKCHHISLMEDRKWKRYIIGDVTSLKSIFHCSNVFTWQWKSSQLFKVQSEMENEHLDLF